MSSDAPQRAQALDPAQSFLVQAPAGSGKTELLVQRFLRLLSVVEAPEEVVALTFTRKAAAEMRQRISAALNTARSGQDAESDHARKTLDLARAALDNDARHGWGLCQNPSRLRVQTLDALCAAITRQMPMLSAFGAQPGVAEDARELYLQAAQATLAELETGQHWSQSIDHLLAHLNNNLERVVALVAQMLARRDQWLRFVVRRDNPQRQRHNLEGVLQALAVAQMHGTADNFPGDQVAEVVALARFAAANLPADNASPIANPIATLGDLRQLPEASLGGLPQWRALARLLQTQAGDWRRKLTVNEGFPPLNQAGSAAEKELFKDMKARMQALLAGFEAQEKLRASLAAVQALPPISYSDAQWQILEALFQVLQLAAANLQLVFAERGTVDFIEMAARASQALGTHDEPTDLALALDYRIRHLLVDEFQDTSVSQFRLLEQLVAGWQTGDGRSLFLVGDPMQSIYRFRQAEVGLYLRVRDHGLGAIDLQYLQLTANFRSQPQVIDWINRVFPAVMPAPHAEDPAAGAISYTPAAAQRDGPQGGVQLHAFAGKNLDGEAERVAEVVTDARRENPAASVAVLVRSRLHVAHLLPRLKSRGLIFQAVDIDALGQRPVVQDLLALTRALLHPADRLSWLAVLRAPWCGLRLADLQVLAGDDRHASVWQAMQNEDLQNALDEDGRARLARVRKVFADSLAERGRRSLRRWVEGTWLALGGPAAVADPTALTEAQSFFDLLDELDEGGDLSDLGRLAQKVEGLFAPPDARADPGLQIMTVHRAKGLEFDVVIVPGLGRPAAGSTQPLLFWLEVPSQSDAQNADLLLAPIAAAGESKEPIYEYLKELDKVKTGYEAGRLLYVAATRARQSLHLMGHLREDKNGDYQPATGSLLQHLWPGVAGEFATAIAMTAPVAEPETTDQPAPPLRRLQADWQLPAPPAGVPPQGQAWAQADSAADYQPVEYQWAGADSRHVGTVVHQFLMQMGRDELRGWDAARVQALKPVICAKLGALGIAPERVGKSANSVITALTNTLADERGRWLLQAHARGGCEQALTGVHQGQLVNIIIDRSFVDEAGTRWIIDYKTGGHEGGATEQFLQREQTRYAPQLQRYAELLAQNEEAPIRLGLYFPMLCGWREWAADEPVEANDGS